MWTESLARAQQSVQGPRGQGPRADRVARKRQSKCPGPPNPTRCTLAPNGLRVNRVCGPIWSVAPSQSLQNLRADRSCTVAPKEPRGKPSRAVAKEKESPVQSGLSVDRDHRASSSCRDEQRADAKQTSTRPAPSGQRSQGPEAGPRTLDAV